MNDPDLPEVVSKVIEFPVHRRGSLADTLSGFPDRKDGPEWHAMRRERVLSLLVADLRGHGAVAERRGAPAADARVDAAIAAAVEVLRASGGERIAVGGRSTQPVVWAEFTDGGHAATAVTAAVALREAVQRAADGVRACIGIDTGRIVETTVGGATPVAYRALGTLRMFAVRLEEFAGPGEIFASASTVGGLAAGTATFRPIGPVRTNPGGETAEAYALLELLRPAHAEANRPGATGS